MPQGFCHGLVLCWSLKSQSDESIDLIADIVSSVARSVTHTGFGLVSLTFGVSCAENAAYVVLYDRVTKA
jgi:hypothetical protein